MNFCAESQGDGELLSQSLLRVHLPVSTAPHAVLDTAHIKGIPRETLTLCNSAYFMCFKMDLFVSYDLTT